MKRGCGLGANAFFLPAAVLVRRELVRFWREKSRVLGFVGSPLVFWLILGSGFGDLGFFFPGALTLTVMMSAVFSSMSLIEDRREGFLLSMLVSPAPRSALVCGKVLGSATLAWLQGLVFLAFLPLTPLRPGFSRILSLAAALYLISFTFTALGFLLAWKMDSTQGFHAVANLILFPLWMVSGAVFSPATAHGWIRGVMKLNPMTYSQALLTSLLNPAAGDQPSWPVSLGVTAACSLALSAAAIFVALEKRPSLPR